MNRFVKSAAAVALATASVGAFAANPMPFVESGASDIVLWVQAVNGSTVSTYAFDTGLNVATVFGNTFTSSANLVALPGTSTSFSSIGQGSTTLASFLSTHSSDTITWAVQGGFYNDPTNATGPNNLKTKNPGTAEAIFTSQLAGASSPDAVSVMDLAAFQQLLSGYSAVGNGPPTGAGSQDSLAGTGGFLNNASQTSTAATWSAGDQAKFGVVQNAGTPDTISALGSPVTLYGITGNGGTGTLQSYTLGTVSLSAAGVLTFASAVPLPGAVWLLGSGLLGLLGVSRRKVA